MEFNVLYAGSTMKFEAAPQKPDPVEEEDIKEFIDDRGVRPEDFDLIRQLAAVDKEIIIQCLHNFFSGYRENSARYLAHERDAAKDPVRKAMYAAMHNFVEKYDWYAGTHLVAVLESR